MNTSPTIRLKRSLTAGSVPSLEQLTYGELAINHFDGTVFVRQDTEGVGISTRVVTVGAGRSIGNTWFVTGAGDDLNSGLSQQDALASIKKASEYAQPGDTIKVSAGYYVENNPIVLRDNVSVEGFELRNCFVAPNNSNKDLFHINNACHLTDLAFIGKGADIGGGSKGVPSGGSAPGFLGEPMQKDKAVIAFVPLEGVSGDRYFDGARMIRQNADYIAGEAVGFLTSGFSGVAGSHRAQDAARLIDLNAEYIAAEAVGFITSVNYAGGAFTMSFGTARDCQDDIHDVLEAVAHDLRAGYKDGTQANSRSVGAAQSYFVGGALSHILGVGISEATIAAMDRAAGIATFVINNKPYGFENVGGGTTITGFEYTPVTGVATVTTLIGHGLTSTDHVNLSGLAFTCDSEHSGVTTTIFPDGSSPSGFNFKIDPNGLFNSNQFVINVGISTIGHTYTPSSGIAYTVYQYSTFEQQFDTGAAAGTAIRGENVVGNGICLNVNNDITELVGIVTSAIGAGNTDSLPGITTGMRLDQNKCRRDVAKIWKAVCYDITRGGNTKVVGAGKSYYDANGNKLSILVDPDEFEQSVIALEYSKDIARRIVNNVRDGSYTIGTAFSISGANYSPTAGILTVTTNVGHGLTAKDTVKLSGLAFSCATHNNSIGVYDFQYDRQSGFSTVILDSDHGLSSGDEFELRNLTFSCGDSGLGPVVNVSNVVYDENVGIITVTTSSASGVFAGEPVQLKNIAFTCAAEHAGVTTTIFPDGSSQNNIDGYGYDVFSVLAVNSATEFQVNVGPSTIAHTYDTGGTVQAGVTTTVFPDVQSNDYVFDAYVGTAGTVIYTNVGISTIEHTYASGGEVRIGVTTTIFPNGGVFGDCFEVKDYISDTQLTVNVGISTFLHVYESGGTIQKTRTFRPDIGQIRDVSIQIDSDTGNNNTVGNCKNVISAMNTAVGIATAIIEDGLRTLQDPLYLTPTGATYDPVGGGLTITVNDHGLTTTDKVKLAPNSINFTCNSDGNITTIGYPDKTSPIFDKFVGISATTTNTFTINAGSIPAFGAGYVHTFVSAATSAVNYGGSGISTRYPGNGGAGSDFIDDPTFSPGTDGPVLKGPYIRNCTNFIENSIGMRIDGFDADPGDKDELGVQGSMSVDSFTQYNQGGIGVSITNGAYAQLVSIFTICCNEAIVTLTGGQCDLTNSNSSFGEFGLVSKGVGDENSSSNYRQTAEVVKAGDPGRTNAQGPYDIGDRKVVLTGVGTQRPYDGQTLFFDELYFSVEKVKVTNGGSGYQGAVPSVTFTDPSGPDGITAQGIPIIEDGVVTDFLVANSGTQYQENSFPTITIGPPPPGGTQATAEVERMQPLYFKVASATLPHNGISTITMSQGLNNDLTGGEVAYITRQSLQITSSHSFEYVGAGNTILTARPSVGGIIIQDNEVVQEDGGLVVYTSTDQAGNFRIGDGIQIDQATGTISGRVYIKSLFNSVTPFILALGGN